MTATTRGVARCGLAAVLFGAAIPFASRLAQDVAAPILGGLLYIGAALAVLPVVRRPTTILRGRGGGVRRLAAAIVFGGFLGPLLLAAGLARTPTVTAALLLNLEVVATVVLAWLFFGEHLGKRLVMGVVLVVGAGGMLAGSGTGDVRLGALLVVGACACWGLDNCVTASLDDIAPASITLAKGVLAGGMNLLVGLLVGATLPSVGTIAAALAVGAVGYGASITLWVSGARELGAARGQLVFATAPFVGAATAWVAFQEPVRPVELLALGFAAVGVASVVRSDHAHEHRHDPVLHEHEHGHDDDRHHDHDHVSAAGDARHAHRHEHRSLVHAHPHVPDLHHRHG